MSFRPSHLGAAFAAAVLLGVAAPTVAAPPQLPQLADDGNKIAQPTAIFSGLDKITGRIISFDVAIDETVQFGALQVTPRVCYSRPQTVTPLTTSFVEVDEITLDNKIRRIFSGWMFADSPGLHAVDHAVYDVWLTDCRGAPEPAPQPRKPEPAPPAKKTQAPADAGAAGAPATARPPRPTPPAPASADPLADPVIDGATPPKPQRRQKPVLTAPVGPDDPQPPLLVQPR